MIGPRRPAIWALWLAILAVGGGALASGIEIARGIDERRAHYDGNLDAGDILDTFQPAMRRGEGRPLEPGEAVLDSARGTAEVNDADAALIAFWAVVELLPWLLGAVVLFAVAPLLRAADRGDPFAASAAGRLAAAGSLLLAGIPLVAFLRFLLAEVGTSGGGISPMVEPALTISVLHFLPGLLVLVLAGVVSSGAELRELERRTV